MGLFGKGKKPENVEQRNRDTPKSRRNAFQRFKYTMVEKVVKFKGRRNVRKLIKGLGDEDIVVRIKSKNALVMGVHAVYELMKALRNKNNIIGKNAFYAVDEIGASAVPELIKITLRNKNKYMRRDAVLILGKIAEDNSKNKDLLNIIGLNLIQVLGDDDFIVIMDVHSALGRVAKVAGHENIAILDTASFALKSSYLWG